MPDTAVPALRRREPGSRGRRALARAGLVHAYGHCSVRLDAHHFLVSPAKPLDWWLRAISCERRHQRRATARSAPRGHRPPTYL